MSVSRRECLQAGAVVMAEGGRSMEMLPLTGVAPTWSDVTQVYSTLSAAQRATAGYATPAAARRAGWRTGHDRWSRTRQ